MNQKSLFSIIALVAISFSARADLPPGAKVISSDQTRMTYAVDGAPGKDGAPTLVNREVYLGDMTYMDTDGKCFRSKARLNNLVDTLGKEAVLIDTPEVLNEVAEVGCPHASAQRVGFDTVTLPPVEK
jgi:hypothetical protein